MTPLVTAFALLLLLASQGSAQPAREPARAGAGTVVRVGDRSLTVRREDGSQIELATDPDTRVQRGGQRLLLAELNPGDRVVVSARSEGSAGEAAPVVEVVQLVEEEGEGEAGGAAAGAPSGTTDTAPGGASEVPVAMRGLEGEDLGRLELRDTHAGLFVRVAMQGLPPGVHAFHVHAVGRCEPPFDSAGDHYTPRGESHGFFAAGGPHAGDLVNLHVGPDGRVEQDLIAARLRLADLLDDDGAAFVVHEQPDDYASQPSGAAGGRIACGAIQREPAAASP